MTASHGSCTCHCRAGHLSCPGHHWRPRGGDRGKRLSKQDFLWTALEHPDVFQRRQKKIAGEHFKDCSSRSQQRKKKREKEQFQQPLSSPLPGMKGSWELGPPLRAVAVATGQHHRPGRQSREQGTGLGLLEPDHSLGLAAGLVCVRGASAGDGSPAVYRSHKQ